MYKLIIVKPTKEKKHSRVIKVCDGSIDDFWFSEEDKKVWGIGKPQK